MSRDTATLCFYANLIFFNPSTMFEEDHIWWGYLQVCFSVVLINIARGINIDIQIYNFPPLHPPLLLVLQPPCHRTAKQKKKHTHTKNM